MIVSQGDFLYKQAADLYMGIFVREPETCEVSFSKEDPNTFEPIFDTPPYPLRAVNGEHLPICYFFGVKELRNLGLRNIQELDKEMFSRLFRTSFQIKYPQQVFSSEKLENHMKTAFIERLNDEWALISKRTLDVKGLSVEEKKRHCQIVAFRVYHFVAENCCPNFKGVYDEVRASLDRLYENQSIRLLKRLVPKECEKESDDLAVSSHVLEELKKRFLSFDNEAVVVALETEIKNYRSNSPVKSKLYLTPEDCLHTWVHDHWESVGKKEYKNSSELAQIDAQQIFLQNCRQHFLEHFPEDPFPETRLPALYRDQAICSLLSSQLLQRVYITKEETGFRVKGLLSTVQEIKVRQIAEEVLFVLERYFGKKISTIDEIKTQVNLQLDDLYIDALKEQSIFEARYFIRVSIISKTARPSLFNCVKKVIKFLKESFPRDSVWDQVEAQERMRVAVEFIKTSALERLAPYKNEFISFRNNENLTPDEIELRINEVKAIIINLVNEEYKEFAELDQQVDRDLSHYRGEIELYLSSQCDVMRKVDELPTINEPK